MQTAADSPRQACSWRSRPRRGAGSRPSAPLSHRRCAVAPAVASHARGTAGLAQCVAHDGACHPPALPTLFSELSADGAAAGTLNSAVGMRRVARRVCAPLWCCKAASGSTVGPSPSVGGLSDAPAPPRQTQDTRRHHGACRYAALAPSCLRSRLLDGERALRSRCCKAPPVASSPFLSRCLQCSAAP